MTKKTVQNILSWCVALAIALLCANLISFFYRSGAGSIQRENAYSRSIRTPNSWIVRGAEGYGINRVDEKGYLNASKLRLSENYILLMGSSHAEGLQVMQRDTMASVLNRMIDPDARTVYNIGTAGHTLPLIVKGFQAAIEEFPNADAIMIEISRLGFSSEDLGKALDQSHFEPSSAGEALAQSLSLSRRIRNDTLGVLPIIALLRQQIESMDVSFAGAFGIERFRNSLKANATSNDNSDIDPESLPAETAGNDDAGDDGTDSGYYDALNRALALLRVAYQEPIIILYHPGVLTQPDGTISIARDMLYYDDFRAACKNNGIVFVDTGDTFLSAYETDYAIPYGFSNTTMQSGHLNQLGHRIVAEAFYKAWAETQDEEKN
ncbi:MAG: SGNH/GDSL hydrolase family protein [Eubacteriales bacterium]|nr:SGNH/GDSL hydrolase family protein [Eubacteriales bacterium]